MFSQLNLCDGHLRIKSNVSPLRQNPLTGAMLDVKMKMDELKNKASILYQQKQAQLVEPAEEVLKLPEVVKQPPVQQVEEIKRENSFKLSFLREVEVEEPQPKELPLFLREDYIYTDKPK